MSFARHSIQTSLVRIFLFGIGMVTGVINARWLGPEGVGLLALVVLLQNVSFRVGNLGFGSALAYFSARKYYSLAIMLKIVWMIGLGMAGLSVFVVVLLWRLPISPWDRMSPLHFYIATLLIPLTYVINFQRRLLSGILKISDINVAELLSAFLTVFLTVLLVIILKTGVIGAIIALLGSSLITFTYTSWRLYKYSFKSVESQNTKQSVFRILLDMWRYGRWNYGIMFMGMFLEDIPVILLENFTAGVASIGLYTRANNWGKYTRIAINPLSQVLFPYTASTEQSRAVLRTCILCRNINVAIFLLLFVLAMFIKPIILVLYGEEFFPAIKLFYYLLPGFLAWPTSYILSVHIAASGKPKLVFKYSLLTIIIGVITGVFLIYYHGAVGAALVSSLQFFLFALFMSISFSRLYQYPILKVLFPQREDSKLYMHMFTLMKDKFNTYRTARNKKNDD